MVFLKDDHFKQFYCVASTWLIENMFFEMFIGLGR